MGRGRLEEWVASVWLVRCVLFFSFWSLGVCWRETNEIPLVSTKNLLSNFLLYLVRKRAYENFLLIHHAYYCFIL